MPDFAAIARVPTRPEDVPSYLQLAIPALIEAIIASDDTQRTLNVAPTKPEEGLLRYADGTNWNPGSGAGLYRYTSGAWVLVMGSGGAGIYLPKAGGTMSGAIAMGTSKITGLGAGAANGDALRYEQLIGLYLLLAGGTMSGDLNMGSQ